MKEPMFLELSGGNIVHANNGRTVVTVAVDQLATADAARVMQTVLAALEVEFTEKISDRFVEELEKALEKPDAEFIVMDGQQITFRFDVIQGIRNKIRRVRNALVKRYDWPTEPTPVNAVDLGMQDMPTPGRGDSDA